MYGTTGKPWGGPSVKIEKASVKIEKATSFNHLLFSITSNPIYWLNIVLCVDVDILQKRKTLNAIIF